MSTPKKPSVSVTAECFARLEIVATAQHIEVSQLVDRIVDSALTDPPDRTLISKVQRNMAFAKRKAGRATQASNARLATERRKSRLP